MKVQTIETKGLSISFLPEKLRREKIKKKKESEKVKRRIKVIKRKGKSVFKRITKRRTSKCFSRDYKYQSVFTKNFKNYLFSKFSIHHVKKSSKSYQKY